ncbi:MAG: N-acetylmuramoyl-L-alanine amidase [Saprospiraceae bacterium]|nr:N-acetylmuramoyl-L-alanine amidase [Saprospiraceae bacterium]MBK7812344.1 N-acetylmuramoyl-L-alanine amidase [Saprospiraceae bacterium]MBK9632431.1 N-acetylmuramoyl-L-alanine amidase [Saprospiraceae bacterium]
MKWTLSGILIVVLLLPIASLAQSPKYLELKAKKGETIIGLLKKYKLNNQNGLMDHFYLINGLKPTETLLSGLSYRLPIEIHKFDGKSIRSSLGIKDYHKAKAIEIYNNSLSTSKIISQSYKISKKIYVPTSYLESKTVNTKQSVSQVVRPKPDKSNNKLQKSNSRTNTTLSSKILVADNRLDSSQIANLYHSSLSENLADFEPGKGTPMVQKISGKSVKIDLFGKDKSMVEIETDALKNQVFYIVPGHGGPDPGAMVKHTSGHVLCEDEYAYDVSLRLARNLIKHGAIVHVIVQDKHNGIRDERYLDCDNDEKVMGNLDMPVNQKKRLRQGMGKVNELFTIHKSDGIKKQWMVSIHIDSQPEANRQDVFFYYQADSRKSKKRAEKLQKVFADKYKAYQKRDYQGTVSTRPLYVIRASNPDPIFVELANIRNLKDQERILSPKNRQVLADWMLEGFLQ